MSISLGIGIKIGGNGGGTDWAAYWASLFTGVPIPYSGNPLISGAVTCNFRAMVLVTGTYHLFEEVTFGVPPYWTINKRTSSDGFTFSARSAALLAAGGVGEFDEWGQADPTVIYDGAGDWKMWFDALNGAGIWDKLGYATSADGTTWANQGSVLERGAGGAWDNAWVHHPACIKHNGFYYLYYAGSQNVGSEYKIGLATSTDGINWTKEPTNPVITVGAGGTFDDNYIRPSCPVKINNTWYMWYWANDGAVHSMGLASSPDLITWTKQGQVLTHANGITGSNGMLFEGTNPRDKIIAQWYCDYPNADMSFTNITLPTLLTKLSPFTIYKIQSGDTSPGGSSGSHAANYIYYYRVSVTEAHTADSLRFYINLASKPTTGTVKTALYSNDTDAPKTLLAITDEKNWSDVTGNVWTQFPFVSNPVLATGDYWVAMWSTQAWYSVKVAGGSKNWTNQSLAYGVYPATATPNAAGDFGDFDAYIEVTFPSIYTIALVGEPTNVYFNNIEGNKVGSIALIDSEFDWFWASNVLYIYSNALADLRYQITYD